MNADCRSAIAYIAARLCLRQNIGEFVEDASRRRCIYSGEVSDAAIHVYDYQRSCQIVGKLGALYDSALRNAIQLSVVGDHFYGYDYESHSRFGGRIEEHRMSLFDAAEGRSFIYRY